VAEGHDLGNHTYGRFKANTSPAKRQDRLSSKIQKVLRPVKRIAKSTTKISAILRPPAFDWDDQVKMQPENNFENKNYNGDQIGSMTCLGRRSCTWDKMIQPQLAKKLRRLSAMWEFR